MRAPPKTSCGLELDKIPAVFVAKAPTIPRWLSVYRLASGNFLCARFPQQVSGGALKHEALAAEWRKGPPDPRSPIALNWTSWKTVRLQNLNEDDYGRALDSIVKALQMWPDQHEFYLTKEE